MKKHYYIVRCTFVLDELIYEWTVDDRKTALKVYALRSQYLFEYEKCGKVELLKVIREKDGVRTLKPIKKITYK